MGHIRTTHSRNYPRGVFHLALCGEDGDDHHDDEEFDDGEAMRFLNHILILYLNARALVKIGNET